MSFVPEYPSLGKRSEDYQPSPAEQVEAQIDWLVRQCDELVAQSRDPGTVEAIESQKHGIGQIITRCQLILSFLETRQQPKFKMVSNNG